MPPVALLIILAILRTVAETDRYTIVSLSLVFGGAIGNYIDRIRFRYVIDFLDFHLQKFYTWPAFNIADSAIVVGVSILLFLELTRVKRSSKAAVAEPVPAAAVESSNDGPRTT
jgi:signal peptidase II